MNIKMKEENKKEVKKNLITGVSTATGAVLGSIIENTFNPVKASAHKIGETEIIEATAEDDASVQESTTAETIATLTMETIEAITADAGIEVTNPTPDYFSETVATATDTNTEPTGEVKVEAVEFTAESDPASRQSETEITGNPTDEDVEIIADPIEAFTGEETADPGENWGTDELLAEIIYDTDVTDNRLTPLGNENLTASALDMPDYVNDANIDSFMDMV